MIRLIAVIIFSVFSMVNASADGHRSADQMCNFINESMLINKPCNVHEADKKVELTHKVTAKQGKLMCVSIRLMTHAKGIRLPDGWKISIRSSLKEGKIVAHCTYEKDKKYYG